MSKKKKEEPAGKLYFMTASLAYVVKEGNKQVRKYISDQLENWMYHYHRIRAKHGDTSAAFNFHVLMDESTDKCIEGAEKPMSCKPGCNFCCKVHIKITEDEGQLLIGFVAQEKIRFDMDRINRQAEFDETNWNKQDTIDWACTFLDPINGSCKVYKHRPGACRAHYVMSDPALCDPRVIDGKVERLYDMDTNLMASAALNSSPSDGMAKVLKKLITPNTEEDAKESWMFKDAIVLALGKKGTITKMQENHLDGTDYVYYISVKLEGEKHSGTYHPDDVKELVVETV